MTRERFIQLISAEQESLRRFLLALCCGNLAEADDIAQDAMLKAYLAMDRYKQKAKFSTWLCKIALNTFLDRRRAAVSGLLSESPSELKTVPAMNTADDAFKYQELYLALSKLPPKERSAVLLFYIQGYSVKEIANITDSTQSAVKTRLSRARSQLKTLIENGR